MPKPNSGNVGTGVAGALGAVGVTLLLRAEAALGVTAALAVDAALVPALLVAVTVKVYAVSLVRPVTLQVSVEPSPVVQDWVLSSTAVAV
jgi:hypothetical protein